MNKHNERSVSVLIVEIVASYIQRTFPYQSIKKGIGFTTSNAFMYFAVRYLPSTYLPVALYSEWPHPSLSQ